MYDNDGKRLGHDDTDFAAYGLSGIYVGQNLRNLGDKADTNTFIADMWEVLDGAGNLLIKKHKDYGPTNISLSPGGPLNGLRVRMHDKTARINNLIDSGSTAQHEPLEDSFKDLANYGIIALLVLRGQWDR